MFEDKKNLACVCDSCEDRLHYYYKLSHVARKNIRMFIENKECLRYRCLMCLKGLNLLDDQQTVVSIFKDNDYALAKIYGKCFHIREVKNIYEGTKCQIFDFCFRFISFLKLKIQTNSANHAITS